MPCRGTPAAFELTVTIAPRWRGDITRAKARPTWNTPSALTANTRRQSASPVSATLPTCSTPATLAASVIGPMLDST